MAEGSVDLKGLSRARARPKPEIARRAEGAEGPPRFNSIPGRARAREHGLTPPYPLHPLQVCECSSVTKSPNGTCLMLGF